MRAAGDARVQRPRLLLLSPLLRLIQTPSELKTFVSVYLTIILASLPAAFLYNLYGALLRAIGRSPRR